MKTRLLHATLAAPLAFAIAPLDCVAQKGSSVTPYRDVTLLPGPTLLSPARGAPQSGPTMTIIPSSLVKRDTELWRASPLQQADVGSSFLQGSGTLKLSYGHNEKAPATSPARPVKPLPAPETLRFDSTLQAPTPTPAPKPGAKPTL